MMEMMKAKARRVLAEIMVKRGKDRRRSDGAVENWEETGCVRRKAVGRTSNRYERVYLASYPSSY